jgi:hypothetical protein
VPEQVNLQLAGAGTLVVGFVTFPANESRAVGSPQIALPPPEVQFWPTPAPAAGPIIAVEGITRRWATPTVNYALLNHHPHYNATETAQLSRHYALHFVKLRGLAARVRYHYRVRCGGPWSDTFGFVAPPSSDKLGTVHPNRSTRIAVFGDMGVFSWNNMGNLRRLAERGMLDALAHIGDHSYNLMQDDDRRGDGYMNAYQPVLTQLPWMPIVGNHEYYDGGKFMRFLSQMGGITGAGLPPARSRHSATSSLGLMLAAGGALGLGSHGSSAGGGAFPSNTSRFFSVDVGLFHLVAIDQNIYWEQQSEQVFRAAQLAWLQADLRAANQNRKHTPWVVVNHSLG